ncbi:hypothetical protein PMPD1_1933 [Paramixta manurensis]|uniref:DUF7480 domain-containing protein n=1 Tax=Paramixta manurensis TaxID=2740817 RepID=A0A6M8UNK6_9GAMM|nr:hypothetical protein PMPD1_1933 [Erwiniaceae bacterium PD-1]
MKYFSLFTVLFLFACKASDPRPKVYSAEVTVREGDVCVLAPATHGEFLSSLEIDGTGDVKRLRKYFSGNPDTIYLLNRQCVPLFGYRFRQGHSYGVSVLLETLEGQKKGEAGRIFTVSFAVSGDRDSQLRVSKIQ